MEIQFFFKFYFFSQKTVNFESKPSKKSLKP